MIGLSRTAEAGRFLLVGAALGLLAALLPGEIPIALSVLGVLVLPVVTWLALRSPREEARVLLPIFLGAVGVRVAVAIAIAYAVPSDYFSLDHTRYQVLGWELAEHWAGRGAPPDLVASKTGYYVWNALLYTVVGYVPLAATLSNAAAAGVSVVLSYRIARDLGGAEAARLAALFTAFFPSLVLWSSLNLKDAFAILAVLVALRGAQRLQSGLSLGGAAALAAGVLCLAQLRDYLVLLVLLSVGVAVLLPRLRSPAARVALASAVALGALSGDVLAPIEEFVDETSFASLDQYRRNLALGDSAYQVDADVSTPGAALRFLPVGLAYFLLAPAPWQLWNARQWITLPEMLIWYALLPQVFIGLRALLRRRVAAALPVAGFALLATLSYSLVESNLGTAYRHRAQVLVLFLVIAAVGIAARRATRRRHASPSPLAEAAAT